MVTVAGVRVTPRENEEDMISLVLEGGLDVMISKTTGLPYAKIKRTLLLCTFAKETAENLVGTEMPGTIVRRKTEPYTWTNKETGEETVLNHTYVFEPDHVDTVVQEEFNLALDEVE